MSDKIKMQFDPQVAKIVGTDAAIIYSNIQFWCTKNEANNKHYHNGRHWTYNSVAAFNMLFDYLTSSQIRTALNKLKKKSYIDEGNYNQHKYDRTKWYCDLRSNKSICQISQMEESDITNASDKPHEPIPDTKPDDKPNNKTDKRYSDDFSDLYERYNKKKGKSEAYKEYKKLDLSDKEEIEKHLPKYIEATPDKQYRKNLNNYLKYRTWEDEVIDYNKTPNKLDEDATNPIDDAYYKPETWNN